MAASCRLSEKITSCGRLFVFRQRHFAQQGPGDNLAGFLKAGAVAAEGARIALPPPVVGIAAGAFGRDSRLLFRFIAADVISPARYFARFR